MNFSDIFRSFFGLNRSEPGAEAPGFHNDFRNPIWNIDDDDDTDDELHHNFGNRHEHNNIPGGGGSFHIFTNPLEMQRYFEQQMNDIMRSFGGMMETFDGFHSPAWSELPVPSNIPSITDKGEGKIRDEYLKPGYSTKTQKNLKADDDLDGKITSGDLDTLFGTKDSGSIHSNDNSSIERFSPHHHTQIPNFFSHTIVTRSITRPDGSVESTRTVKNSEGLEETTVTVTQGRDNTLGLEGPRDLAPYDNFWKNLFGQ